MKILAISIFSLFYTFAYSQIIEIFSTETCPNLSEGEIDIEIDPNYTTNYSFPFFVKWINLSNGESQTMEINSYIFTLSNLSIGEYIINIELGDGCQIEVEEVVSGFEYSDILLTKKVDKATCGNSDGRLTLIPKSGILPWEFVWEPEATVFPHSDFPGAYMLDNIEAGVYCVTITDQACGIAEFCVDVPNEFPDVTIVDIQNIDDCPQNSCDGRIEIAVNGISIPFTVEWENSENEIVGTGKALNNICEQGLYIAKVYFSEICEPWIYPVRITCCGSGSSLDISLNPIPGCNGNNAIETSVTGGTPPLIYTWNNFNHTQNPNNLPNGEYTLTVTDSQGCTASETISFFPVEMLEVIKPCEGMFDGEISFQINNPENCNIDVLYDFSLCSDCTNFPLINNNTNTTINFTLENLGGGIEYLFYVDICGCIQEIKFTLDEIPFDRNFVSVEEIENDVYVCIYDIECKNTQVEEGDLELATVDLNHEDCDPTSFPRKCGSIDYYCDPEGSPIASKIMRKKLMRRGEAILLAQELGIYPPEEIQFQLQGNPCDRIFVCPNAPVCQGIGFIGEFGGHFNGVTEIDEDGCYKVKCRLLGILGIGFTYKICGKDYLPSYLAAYYDPSIPISININSEDCIPIEKNSFEIYQHLESLEDDVLNFKGSELHGLLVINANNPNLLCGSIRFCASDFKVIWHNLYEIICDLPLMVGGECDDIDETCEPCAINSENEIYVWCTVPCPDAPGELCSLPKVINTDYDDFDIIGLTNPNPPQIISNRTTSTNFLCFSPAIHENNFISLNAIYKREGDRVYHPFNYERFYPYKIDNLEYLFQHFDSSYIFAIVKDSAEVSKSILFYQDDRNSQELSLSASQSLELHKTWSSSNQNFITGLFQGNLVLDNNIIATSTLSENYFIAKLTKDINLLNIRKVSSNGWNIITDEQSGNLAIYSSINQLLYIDNGLVNGISQNEIITLDGSGSNSHRDINLIISPSMKLIEYKRGNNYSGYLIAGKGIISLMGNQIYQSSNDNVIFLAIDNLGSSSSLKYLKDFSLSSIDTTNISIEMVGLDTVFVALNTKDNIVVEGNVMQNIGGKDIIILGYNNLGALVVREHYGSIGDEILNDIFFTNGILYMGGEIGDSTFRRTIGELDFVNFSPGFTHSFISYKIINELSISQGLLSSESSEQPVSEWKPTLEVFPNPVSGIANIRANQECDIITINIHSMDGRTILSELSTREKLLNSHLLSTSNIPNGVYFASTYSNCSHLISKPFIITN